MIDPKASRRPSTSQQAKHSFMRCVWAGPTLIVAAVVASILSSPVREIVHNPQLPNDLFAQSILLSFNYSMYLLTFIVPSALAAAGLGVPILGYMRYADFAQQPKVAYADGVKVFPVQRAGMIVAAETVALLLVCSLAFIWANPADSRNAGIDEPELIMRDKPGEGWY